MYFIRIAPDYDVQFWVTASAASPGSVFHLFFSMPTSVSDGHLQSKLYSSVRWNSLLTWPAVSAWSWSLEMMRLQDAALWNKSRWIQCRSEQSSILTEPRLDSRFIPVSGCQPATRKPA
jgi:hypothetical protein